jgi:hypothetical protein
MNDDEMGSWYPYEDGDTINDIGPEGGYILRDEEYGDPDDPEDADIRLTLEQGKADNPGFFLTSNLYGGWLYQVTKYATEAEAAAQYDAAKGELVHLAAMIPMEDDRDVQGKVQKLLEAVGEFEKRFA